MRGDADQRGMGTDCETLVLIQVRIGVYSFK